MKKLLLLGIFLTHLLGATEFLYPIAALPDADHLLMIYQKTAHHIELWQWNVHTKLAETILLSRYTPAGVRLLPDNLGYSFIDNGRIRIKQWIKRSPRSIELDGPITHIELIDWIDQHTFYTSGKYQDHFGVFQIDDEGVVCPVFMGIDSDIIYPQKVGSSLFVVERDKNRHYSVISIPYDAQGQKLDEFCSRMSNFHYPGYKKVIFESGLQPIVFLNMVSLREGFFLSHPRMVRKKDPHILLSYYHISNNDNEWVSELMFTFYVPTNLFFPGRESRLYEALLPLVPRHIQDGIFYSDCQEQPGLNLYYYSLSDKQSTLINRSVCENHIFPPVSLGSFFYYWGTLSDGLDDLIKMEVDQEGVRVTMGVLSFI